jgi:predicted Zn-dependent protease
MTIHRISRRVAVAGASSLIAAPALAQFNPFGRGGGIDIGNVLSNTVDMFKGMDIREADEIKMGESYYDGFIEQSGGRYGNEAAQQALREFAQPVIATSTRSAFRWDVVLLNDDTVNAWAVPGGKLGINRGLVRYCAEPADLAAVISHEVGHAELSHAKGQMRSQAFQKGLTGIGKEVVASRTSVVGRGLSDQLVDALAGPIFSMITSGYSQDREFEADNHVLGVFTKTGFLPSRASNFYRTMLALVPPTQQGSTSLYPSHPGMIGRIDRLDKAAPNYPAPATPAAAQGWRELKRIFPTRRPKKQT